MGNNASFQSAKEDRELPIPRSLPIVETRNVNGWDNVTGESSHSGWAASGGTSGINDQGWLDKSTEAPHNGWGEGATQSKDNSGKHLSGGSSRISDQGWLDKSTETQHMGWGETSSGSNDNIKKCSSDRPRHQEVSTNGWMDEPAKDEYNGWIRDPAKIELNGWLDEPVKDEHDGWSLPQCIHFNNPIKDDTQKPDSVHPQNQSSIGYPSLVPPAPSAPPLPEEVIYEGVAHYPSVDSSPVDVPGPSIKHYPLIDSSPVDVASSRSDTREENSLCIICWDAPVQGACHMAACVECLNEIKLKKGDCPVCRAKIDQAIRLYGV